MFGVGSLGGALLRDSGLHHFGLEIVGAFDINPELVGKEINGIPIYHSDEFEVKMKSCDVNIGVLTVPINIAQEITDKMIAGGIKAVWNFTPFRIRAVSYTHLAPIIRRRYRSGSENFFRIYMPCVDYWMLADNSCTPRVIVADAFRLGDEAHIYNQELFTKIRSYVN